jgi:L-asparagine transporter-like permease
MMNKVKEVINNVDRKGYDKDTVCVAKGIMAIAITFLITMGPKKYFKTLYSPKGLLVGSIASLILSSTIVLNNQKETETKE